MMTSLCRNPASKVAALNCGLLCSILAPAHHTQSSPISLQGNRLPPSDASMQSKARLISLEVRLYVCKAVAWLHRREALHLRSDRGQNDAGLARTPENF